MPTIDLAALDAAKGEREDPVWLGKCMPTTGGGAWVMAIDDLWDDSDGSTGGRLAIGYVEPNGKVRFASLNWQDYAYPGASAEELVYRGGDFSLESNRERGYGFTTELFDWDGDGSEELFLFVDTWNMRRFAAAGRIWTYRGGTLRLYGPTRALSVSGLKDVDEDGRPDLILTIGSTWYLSERLSGSVGRGALELVSHSLPDGTFSSKDAVAVEFARKTCPPPTADISTQWELGCARVRGLSAGEVTARLERTCAKNPDAGECDDLDNLREFAEERPLLVLPAEP